MNPITLISHPWRIASRATLGAISLLLCGRAALQSLAAAPAAVATLEKRTDATLDEAYNAFKNGDTAGGLIKLQSKIERGPTAPHEDLQLAKGLASLSCVLKNEGNSPRAVQLASLSLTKIAQPQGRMAAKDATASYLLAGELYDHILADRAKARIAYQQALALDPQIEWAAARLQHLGAIDEAAKSKAQANALLQQRARSSKK